MRNSSSRARSRSLVKATELAFAAPQVVALRSLQALASAGKPALRDRREWMRMGTEKADAFTRSLTAMNAQWMRAGFELPFVLMGPWWKLWLAAWTTVPGRPIRNRALERHWQRTTWRAFDSALAPVHATAIANARRLSRAGR